MNITAEVNTKVSITAKRECPRTVTSRRSIKYRPSGWCVHEFEVWSGERICRAAALRMAGSLLVWLGGGGAEPYLREVALGVPSAGRGCDACATPLLGAQGEAAALARRLAAALARPVYVCCGSTFDRFTMPLVERGLAAQIKSRPDCF